MQYNVLLYSTERLWEVNPLNCLHFLKLAHESQHSVSAVCGFQYLHHMTIELDERGMWSVSESG